MVYCLVCEASLRSSVLRALARCSGGIWFESRREFSFFPVYPSQLTSISLEVHFDATFFKYILCEKMSVRDKQIFFPVDVLSSRIDSSIDQFRYVQIQPITIDLSTWLWGRNPTNSVFISQSLVLRSIVWCWILIYRNWFISFYKITEILRTLWLVNRVAKPMFYCTGKPWFPIYGSF